MVDIFIVNKYWKLNLKATQLEKFLAAERYFYLTFTTLYSKRSSLHIKEINVFLK